MQIVVNCFRSLYLWVDLQLTGVAADVPGGCELLSFFVPLGWFTAWRYQIGMCWRCELLSFFVPLGWFTAILKLTDWAIRCELLSFFVPLGWFTAINWVKVPIGVVVNCFRSLYLWVDLQLLHWRSILCCKLWIAFVLCTFGLIYSWYLVESICWFVVNCFRSLYLWVDLQLVMWSMSTRASCELLSFFVPLGWFTAIRRKKRIWK